MGALLDSYSGAGYTGDYGEADGVGDSSGGYFVQGAPTQSGIWQQLAGNVSGSLARGIDYAIQRKIVGDQPMPVLRTTQNGVGGYAGLTRTNGGQQIAQINLSAIMPMALVAVAVYFLAKKG